MSDEAESGAPRRGGGPPADPSLEEPRTGESQSSDPAPPSTPILFVSCIVPDSKDAGAAIDRIGGTDEAGREWHLPLEDAVALAKRGVRFAIKQGRRPTPLEVVETERGVDYLRGVGGGARLAELPRCTHLRFTPPDIRVPEPDRGALFDDCREALAYVRRNCPGLLPSAPLAAGEVGAPVPVDRERAGALVQTAAKQGAARAAGRRPAASEDLPRVVLWGEGADELLVLLDTVTVDTAEGVVTVGVNVACDELVSAAAGPSPALRSPVTAITVDLVIGTEARPTGLLAAATTPRGDPLIVARWGDRLVAFAWQALLDASTGIAAAAGADDAGLPLVPLSWTADVTGLQIAPRARHLGDRLAALAAPA